MSNKKEISIDWLLSKISYQSHDGRVLVFHQDITQIIVEFQELYKKEIMDAYIEGYSRDGYTDAEIYYSQKFGGKK